MFQASHRVIYVLLSLFTCHGYRGEISSRVSFVASRPERGIPRVSTSDGTRTEFPRIPKVRTADPLYTTPQVNPNLETGKKSLSGISYESVLSALDQLYPPQGLQIRNAASRTDGYWAFISQGEEPPMDLTYGEFDFHFFAQILDRAHHHYYYQSHEEPTPNTWKDKVMLDMGSGTGRLVLGAASLHPDWKECRGIEMLQGIHDFAVEKLAECTGDNASRVLPSVVENSSPLTMAPVKLTCGSFEDPSISLGDVDCAFAFSSCFSTDLMKRLGQAVGRQCKPGAIIITTDYMIPLENSIPPIEGDDRTGSYKLELAEKLDGWCWLTGGESTAYIHRVVHGLSS